MFDALKFDPDRVSVAFEAKTTGIEAESLLQRRYTLTHNDLTRNLTLTGECIFIYARLSLSTLFDRRTRCAAPTIDANGRLTDKSTLFLPRTQWERHSTMRKRPSGTPDYFEMRF